MIVKTEEIKEIRILYPELMSSQASTLIKNKLLDLKELTDKKSEYFRLQEEANEKIKKLRAELDALDKLYEVEYVTKEVEDKMNDTCFTVVESNGTVHI